MPKALTSVSPSAWLSTSPRLLEEDFARIEALLGVGLSPEDRSNIESMRFFSDYYFSSYEQDGWQSESVVLWDQHKKIRAGIKRSIDKLTAHLARLRAVKGQTFRLYLQTWEAMRRQRPADPFRALVDLVAEVENTVFAIKPGKGRHANKSDHPITTYAARLVEMFKALTGTLPSVEKSRKRNKFPDPFYEQAWGLTKALGLDRHIADRDEFFEALHKAVKLRERVAGRRKTRRRRRA
jgi:hypothetical protein